MAWPVDARNVTFLNGTVVSPSFLNDIEDKVIGLYGGTLSLKAIVVDGTGAQTVAGTAGTMQATNVVGTTSVRAPSVYATGTSSAITIIPASDMQVGVNPSKVSFGVTNWTFVTDATGTVVCPIRLPPFQNGGATSTTIITDISFRLNQAGAVQMALSLNKVNNIDNAGGSPSGSTVSTANSGVATGNKIITLSSLAYTVNSSECLYAQIQPGQASDVIYAVTVKYTYNLF